MDGRKEKFRSYIEEISKKYSDNLSEMEKKIGILEKKLSRIEEEAEENARLQQNTVSCTEHEERVAQLTAEIESLKAGNEALENEKNQLADRLAELDKAAESTNELFEKSAKYDQVSSQIGSMIVSANARAESIVSEAELKARLSSKAMVDTTMERLNDINNKYTGEIIAKALQLAEDLRSLSLSAESFRTDTKSAIETDCILLKEYLEKTKKIILEDNNE